VGHKDCKGRLDRLVLRDQPGLMELLVRRGRKARLVRLARQDRKVTWAWRVRPARPAQPEQPGRKDSPVPLARPDRRAASG
jgi:hypothetical protein